MDNVPNSTVICQCLKMLSVNTSRDKELDYRAQKLFVGSSILMFIEAQLQQRHSYYEMVEHLVANDTFQKMLGLESISISQLSRKMRQLPTTELQNLFFSLLKKIKELTGDRRGVSVHMGELKGVRLYRNHLATYSFKMGLLFKI